MDASLLGAVVVTVMVGGAVAVATSKESVAREVTLVAGAAVAFSSMAYAVIRAVFFLINKPDYCDVPPWDMGQCYGDMILMGAVAGVSLAVGVYLVGKAIRYALRTS